MRKILGVALFKGENNKQTLDYFERLGFIIPNLEYESLPVYLELRDIPEIIITLEQAGYLKDKSFKNLPIQNISDEGISLYLVSHSEPKFKDVRWKECCIFIPKENIIAIHNVDSEFLNDLKSGNF